MQNRRPSLAATTSDDLAKSGVADFGHRNDPYGRHMVRVGVGNQNESNMQVSAG